MIYNTVNTNLGSLDTTCFASRRIKVEDVAHAIILQILLKDLQRFYYYR